ncbi:hypothetical protein [Rufibacter latericius]|uniref:Uncharacterized protein n=1 Tax=Rufibacter latericius TaxID=2487040 RepID=A0A3M9MML5_9BACT|nr:hypothetical protein [Rufibacter latericius]RNI26774.1 hypothetical protein EFB08_09785 [Rufibacter latericius]
MENQFNNQPGAAAQDATSYSQDSAQNSSRSQGQSSGQGGILGSITSGLSNIQVPQAVKNLGTSVSRSYSGMSTTQKVLGGAALLGASYWVANNQGWIGQAKSSISKSGVSGKLGKKSKGSKNQHSADQYSTGQYNS